MAIVVPMTAILWIIDPFRIFHKPWIRDNYYYNKPIIQASGIINTDDFKSIILGSSMAANFSPGEATRIFRNKFVNLTLDGTSLAERSVVLRYALARRNLSEVIISIDWETLDTSSIRGSPIENYSYLYDENRVNDLLVYASNPDTLRFIFCKNLIYRGDHLCRKKIRSLESLVEWQSNLDRNNRFGGIENWSGGKKHSKFIEYLKGISNSIEHSESGIHPHVNMTNLSAATSRHKLVFERNILAYAKKYSNTNFYLFFPPYSRLRFALLAQSQPQIFNEYLEDIRFIVKLSSTHQNIRVFGFENESFPDNIANYMDTVHYHQRFNSMMLEWMASGSHQLKPSNIERYIEQITARANNYSFKSISEKINSYLNKIH